MTAGYTYWAFNDYRLHPENGNWPQRLGALPAVMGGFSFPRLDQPAWTASNVYVMGDQFLYYSGNDADTMLGRGRAVMALLGVALGALVYAWTRRLVSPAGAWVSLGAVRVQPHAAGARPARHVGHGRRAVLHGRHRRHVGCAAPGDARHGRRRRGAGGRRLPVETVGADPGADRPRDAGRTR